ncbi:MAG TPA: hypothetical protein VFD58_22100 [Blastocatellia bacterium]|nr:hypothetical protein [Blastocatellia bacterium]
MAAEPNTTGEPHRVQYLSLVALYDREEDANELLGRLDALYIDTTEATIVRVDNSLPAAVKTPDAAGLSPLGRITLTGAIIGSAAGFLAGFILYEAGLFRLPFGGLFHHVLASALAGAIIGGVIGATARSAGQKVKAKSAPPPPLRQSRNGFLVVVKVPPRLAEQAETIARRLGAKEIIL